MHGQQLLPYCIFFISFSDFILFILSFVILSVGIRNVASFASWSVVPISRALSLNFRVLFAIWFEYFRLLSNHSCFILVIWSLIVVISCSITSLLVIEKFSLNGFKHSFNVWIFFLNFQFLGFVHYFSYFSSFQNKNSFTFN